MEQFEKGITRRPNSVLEATFELPHAGFHALKKPRWPRKKSKTIFVA